MDYEMVAGFAGSGDVEYTALDPLLDWILPDKCLCLIPASYGEEPGLKKVQEWCADVLSLYEPGEIDLEYQITDRSMNMVSLLAANKNQAEELALIVLGIEGSEQLILEAWENYIDVYDLTRALYVVQQGIDIDDALYEPVTHSHEVSDGLGGRGSLDIFASQDGSQSDVQPNEFPTDRKRIEEIVTGLIQVHEQQYHQPEIGTTIGGLPTTEKIVAEGNYEIVKSNQLIRCLKNTKSGAIKVSPRAKPKAGEEEIWLTQEEIDGS